MATYVLLTKVSAASMSSPEKLKELEAAVKRKVAKQCPQVKCEVGNELRDPGALRLPRRAGSTG